MRRSSVDAVVGLAALIAPLAATTGCRTESPARGDRAPEAAVTRVEVVRPQRATIRRSTEQPGQIEAYEETPIYAKIAGYVQKWNVDLGAKVKKGQVLAILSAPEIDAEADQKLSLVDEAQAKLAQAKASEDVARAKLASVQAKLAEAQAGIKRADADLELCRAQYKRIDQLVKDRAVNNSVLDEARNKLGSSESAREEMSAHVKTAEADVLESKAMLEKAQSDVTAATASVKVARHDARRIQVLRDYETIVAPYDGVITRRHVDVGDLTEPGNHGGSLFTIDRDDIVRIVVSVPEMYATEVDIGDRALIRLQAIAGKEFEGTVTRTSWTLDSKTRTLRAEIDIKNPTGTLRPGLYAYVTIIVDEHKGALCVPSTALVKEDSKTFCVVVANGKAKRTPVVLGLDDGTRAEIISGLTGDEDIVKAYASSLVQDQAVQIIAQPPK
jgi:RND family efflux transporter MFP subunit